jgi:protein CWC15
VRDLRAELLKAEAAHFAKTKGVKEEPSSPTAAPKRRLEGVPDSGDIEDEDPEAKRRRILEETRDIDADSDGAASDSSSDEDRWASMVSPLFGNLR